MGIARDPGTDECLQPQERSSGRDLNTWKETRMDILLRIKTFILSKQFC